MPTPTPWLNGFQVNTGTAATGVQDFPKIIGLSNGNILVVWEEGEDGVVAGSAGHDIVGKIYDAEGNVVRNSFQLNTNWLVDDEGDFDVAATGGGGFVLVYVDNDIGTPDESAIRWERFDANGDYAAGGTLASESAADDFLANPQVAVNQADNSFIVSYTDDVGTNTDINGRYVSANGVAGAEFELAQNSTGFDRDGDVAILANGNIVSVYEEDDGGVTSIEVHITDTSGNVIANVQPTNGVDSGSDPRVATLANGNLVVTWAESGDIKARIYDQSGNSISGEFNITDTADSENEADVVALPSGGFTVFWDNDTDLVLEAQSFLADGTADGGVISFAPGVANRSEIDLSADGRLLFAWREDGEIHASIWDPRPNTINAEDYLTGAPNFLDNEGPLVGGMGSTTLLGSAGADWLLGVDAADNLQGGGGNDTLNGGGGSDTTQGGAGNDRIVDTDFVNFDNHDGGDGIDTIDYSGVTFAGSVTVNLTGGVTSVGGGGNTETIANFENIIGSQGTDTLIGSAGANDIRGQNGNDSIAGAAGNDTLYGEDGNDILVGGDGFDLLSGGIGADQLFGGAGNDTMVGGDDNDTLAGGDDNDNIAGQNGADELFGGAGNDTVSGGDGNDSMTGNAGNDLISGGAGVDTMLGGDGADTMTGGTENDLVYGNGGADEVYGGDGNDTLSGGNQDDLVTGNSDDDLVAGEAGNDSVYGGDGNDTAVGGDGNDFVAGNAGADEVYGGLGADTIDAGFDNDLASGAEGNDVVSGNDGNDTVFGGDGDDTVVGGNGNDSMFGNAGMDDMFGGSGLDTLNGGAGDDSLFGNADADLLLGDVGNDTLNGGDGNDELRGGGDNDMLFGGANADTLNGGAGNDTLNGGNGNDLYVFDLAAGNDVIQGFSAGMGTEDVIDLSIYNGTFDNFADVLAATSDDGMGNTVIDLGGGNSITLNGVLEASLHQDDFLF